MAFAGELDSLSNALWETKSDIPRWEHNREVELMLPERNPELVAKLTQFQAKTMTNVHAYENPADSLISLSYHPFYKGIGSKQPRNFISVES